MPLTEDVTVRRKLNPRAEATEERRQQILAAAEAAFADHGYNATSLRDVAGRAGLSHTGLLHHFPDKPGLLEAVLDNHVQLAATEYPLESADGEVFLRALVDIARRDVAEPANLRLFAMLAAEALTPAHPAHGYMARWYSQVRTRLTEAFADLDARGLFRGRPVTPEQAAVHVTAMRDGVTLQWLLAPTQVDFIGSIRSQIQIYADVDL
jgi:AcrR family transcriptional regulator